MPETFAINNFFQINNVFNSFRSQLDLIFITINQISVNAAPILVVPEDCYQPTLAFVLTPKIILTMICSAYSLFDFRMADYTSLNNFVLS